MYVLTSLRNTRSRFLPFEHHAWIMSELLNKVKEDPKSNHNFYLLLQYVTSACVEKMRRRLANSILSRPFYNSLTNVDTSTFVFPAKLPCKASDSTRDKPFLLFIQTSNISMQCYPNLCEQAQAAADGKPFEAYTECTQEEFHAFFCGFLEQFDTSLNTLANYPDSRETYQDLLEKATIAGFGLLLLAGSAAIEKHMQSIGVELGDHRRNKANDGATARNDKEEEDEDLLSVQPTDEAPLWQSYVDWLKLMVVHFNASHILSKYVGGQTFQCDRIAIKILAPPTPDDIILPWHCLLDSEHFPVSTGGDAPSNATIVEFLYSFSISWDEYDIDEVIEFLNGLNPDDPPQASDIDDIIALLKPLGNRKSPVRDKCITDVIATIESWKNDVTSFNEDSVNGIVETLERANTITRIFKNLNIESFAKGIQFTKPFHCELVLGSIISLCRTGTLPPELEVVFNELHVSCACSPYWIFFTSHATL